VDAGWSFDGQMKREGFLVYDREYGVISTEAGLMQPGPARWEWECETMVSCPWPYDDDTDKQVIQSRIAALKAQLREHCKDVQMRQERQERKKQKASVPPPKLPAESMHEDEQ
jgi:hypothetical protein